MKEKGDVLMPQLNKGGKFVFGLSLIHDDLTVQFPTQALEEYQVLNDDKIIIFTGSKVTGGFCVTTYPLLSKSKLSHILHECPQLEKQSIPRGTLVTYKGRTKIRNDTELINFPLFCPKCKQETIINMKRGNIIIREPDAKTQSR